MKKTKILLVGALLLGVPSVALSLSTQQENATVVRAATTAICELTFPDENKSTNGVSSYTDTWSAKSGNYNFEIKNANNNNWNSWKYIKFGSKKNASIGSIETINAIENVSTIKLTIDKITAASINSIKLEKSSDASFTKIDSTLTLDVLSTGIKEFEINDTGTSYYKFTFDCKKGSGNGFLQISKVGFYNVSVDESKYSVTFDSDGGTTIDSIDVSNDGQTKVEEPVSPTKKGYIFDGWYNNDTKWNFNDPVKSNMTLKAHWKNIDVTNIADATTENEVYRITGKIVARTNGQNYYIQDNTGAILVYASLTSYGINEGDTISITGTKTMFNNCPELKDCFAIEKNNESINITPITELSDVTQDNVCKYVELKNITLKADFKTATSIKTDKDFVIRANTNYFEIKNDEVLKSGDKINLKGVISIFDKEFQVLPTYMEKVTSDNEIDETILTTDYLYTNIIIGDADPSKAIRFIGSVNETKFADLQKVGFNFTLNNTTTKEYNTELSKLYHIIDDSDKAFDVESDEIYVKDGYLNYSLILNNIPDDFTGTITYYAFATINNVNYQTEAKTINLVNGTESK